nr:helix-turn-helix transcriptional regulator [uncultured Flavobacterium sp.]
MENFNKRLLIIFEKYSLNAASFADKIGVQRSSLSHILSGRNKPSLDFILKIYENFPGISLTWLTLGEGDYFINNETSPTIPIADIKVSKDEDNLLDFQYDNEDNLIEEKLKESENFILKNTTKTIQNQIPKNNFKSPNINAEPEIENITIFYKDGTFKIFRSR